MTFWKALPALALALLALVPAAPAHPPIADPHNSCTGLPFFAGPPVPMAPVPAVNSYVAAPAGLPCAGPQEFGSHEGPCPPPPFVGPFGNKFCGPVVPPGALATCTWAGTSPIVGVVVGFDLNLDGFVKVFPPVGTPPEFPVAGPIPPGSWSIPNPLPGPARVIAYPADALLGGVVLPLPLAWTVGC